MAFRCSIQRDFQQLYLPTGNPTVHLPPHPSSVHHRRACSDSSSSFWESKTPPADCISIHIYPCHRKRPADSVDTAYGSTRSWCHNLHRFVPRLWYENKHLLSHAKDGRNALIESGVTLIEVKGIHNKSLAIDNHTLIEGSFNWLSANRHKEYSRHECSIIVSSFKPMNTSTI